MPSRMRQLEIQIVKLIKESLCLLKAQLREVETKATDPNDVSEHAKRILSSCDDLEERRAELETEMSWMDGKEEQLMVRKGRQVLDYFQDAKIGREEEDLEKLKSEIKSVIGRASFEIN